MKKFAGAFAFATGSACAGLVCYPLFSAPWPSSDDCAHSLAPARAGRKRSRDEKGAPRVVIVGGGVVGAATAYALASRGYRPTVVEAQKEIAPRQAASWGNACLVSTNTFTDFSSPDVFFKSFAAPMLRGFASSLKFGVGTDLSACKTCEERHQQHSTNVFMQWWELANDPLFYRFAAFFFRMMLLRTADASKWQHWDSEVTKACHDDIWTFAQRESLVKKCRLRRDGVMVVNVLPPTGAEVADGALDWVAKREPFVAFNPLRIASAYVEPATSGSSREFAVGLAQRVHHLGGEIILESRVDRIETAPEDGSVCGVVLDNGRTIDADVVVVCAGWQTPQLLMQSVGLYVPIHPMRGYSMTATVHDAKLVHGATTVFSPYGLYLARPSETSARATCYGEFTSVRNAALPTPQLEKRLENLIEHCAPSLVKGTHQRTMWCGCRPQTPDSLPIVSATRVPGLFVNSGHSAYGWKFSAHTANVLADVVEGKSNKFAHLYALKRFQ